MPRLLTATPGAPGIYRLPPERPRAPLGVPMDVCAFVGVAPRGPVRVPKVLEGRGEYLPVDPEYPRSRSVAVPVESFDEYRRLFGGFEGPGRLPYAVASFFEQGGRKAYVVRVVADYPDSIEALAGRAEAKLPGVDADGFAVGLAARSEGAWGNGLQSSLGFTTTPLLPPLGHPEPALLVFEPSAPLVSGSLLRLVYANPELHPPLLRFISLLREEGDPAGPGRRLLAILDASLPALPVAAEVVEGDLLLEDGAGTNERFTHLGLSASHPRWAARELYDRSELVYPHQDWVDRDLIPSGNLPRRPDLEGAYGVGFAGGTDRYTDILNEHFFDPGWTPAEPEPGEGIAAAARLPDVSTLVVPDLYVAEPLPLRVSADGSGSLASASFAPCARDSVASIVPGSLSPELPGLRLDPGLPDELIRIIDLQQRLVNFAELHRGLVVLLDVPPGLSQHRVLDWRARFDSSYAAAYHPWLKIARADDGRDGPVTLNPSAAAAGIVAAREIAFGVPHGPANRLAAGAFGVTDSVSPARHDQLHPLGINVYLRERDGVRLSAARTLSRDRRWRQLSVRRLMLMLTRALEQQMQWVVFEPNGPRLWLEVRQLLRAYLRGLFQAGAFRGASEDEAFFVRCDAELNDRRSLDAGRMLAEVGVAPSEPLEYIVVRISRGGDGTLTLET